MKNYDLEFKQNGSLQIGDDYYDAITIDKGYLILDHINRSSIFYSEHKHKMIRRKISKNNTIKLSNAICDVSKIEGVLFHLNRG